MGFTVSKTGECRYHAAGAGMDVDQFVRTYFNNDHQAFRAANKHLNLGSQAIQKVNLPPAIRPAVGTIDALDLPKYQGNGNRTRDLHSTTRKDAKAPTNRHAPVTAALTAAFREIPPGSCGDMVTFMINRALLATGRSGLLPPDNEGVGIPGLLSGMYGSRMISKRELTRELLLSLGPGTVITMKKGKKDHAEMTMVDPATGDLKVLSRDRHGVPYFKEITDSYIDELVRSWPQLNITNPFLG